jgi:hypothetical protein
MAPPPDRKKIWALGEEIGWRGFLVPELAKLMRFTFSRNRGISVHVRDCEYALVQGSRFDTVAPMRHLLAVQFAAAFFTFRKDALITGVALPIDVVLYAGFA